MKNENGIEMSEKDILHETLGLMADVCSLLFETQSDKAVAAAFMADSLIKYLQVIYRDHDVLRAACDYEAYEHEVYVKSGKHLKEVK